MAAVWTALQEEISATVDDFREKGAIGTLKDAALDAKDITAETGGWLWGGVKDWVAEEPAEQGGQTREQGGVQGLLSGLKREVRDTVQEFQEKGAVGALTDAALDVVDMAKAAGTIARDGIKQEVHFTVQELQEKGAAGTLQDAALDVVDLAKTAGGMAASVANTIAWGEGAQPAGASPPLPLLPSQAVAPASPSAGAGLACRSSSSAASSASGDVATERTAETAKAMSTAPVAETMDVAEFPRRAQPPAQPPQAEGPGQSASRWGGRWFGWGSTSAAAEPAAPAAPADADADVVFRESPAPAEEPARATEERFGAPDPVLKEGLQRRTTQRRRKEQDEEVID